MVMLPLFLLPKSGEHASTWEIRKRNVFQNRINCLFIDQDYELQPISFEDAVILTQEGKHCNFFRFCPPAFPSQATAVIIVVQRVTTSRRQKRINNHLIINPL